MTESSYNNPQGMTKVATAPTEMPGEPILGAAQRVVLQELVFELHDYLTSVEADWRHAGSRHHTRAKELLARMGTRGAWRSYVERLCAQTPAELPEDILGYLKLESSGWPEGTRLKLAAKYLPTRRWPERALVLIDGWMARHDGDRWTIIGPLVEVEVPEAVFEQLRNGQGVLMGYAPSSVATPTPTELFSPKGCTP